MYIARFSTLSVTDTLFCSAHHLCPATKKSPLVYTIACQKEAAWWSILATIVRAGR